MNQIYLAPNIYHYLSLIICVIISMSCSKTNCDITDQSLIGEWQLIEQIISDGSSSKWESIKDGPTFTLSDDGTFIGIDIFSMCGVGTYQSSDTEVLLTPSCNPDSEVFIYGYSLECDNLFLSPKSVICIEGCSFKYQKINS